MMVNIVMLLYVYSVASFFWTHDQDTMEHQMRVYDTSEEVRSNETNLKLFGQLHFFEGDKMRLMNYTEA